MDLCWKAASIIAAWKCGINTVKSIRMWHLFCFKAKRLIKGQVIVRREEDWRQNTATVRMKAELTEQWQRRGKRGGVLDKIEVDSTNGAESFITHLLRDIISPPPIWRLLLITLPGAMTHWLLRCGRLANEEIGPVCLPMSFNERADKQQRKRQGKKTFIITSTMITLFHPVY